MQFWRQTENEDLMDREESMSARVFSTYINWAWLYKREVPEPAIDL